MSKRTPEEILKQLEKPASAWGREEGAAGSEGDEEMDRVLAMTDEEVEAELVAQKVDVGALDAKAEALVGAQAQAQAQARHAKVIPLRPRASQLWARAAAAAVMLAPAGLLALSEIGEGLMVAAAPDAGDGRLEAAALRSKAADALEAGQWARCIELLDEAKKKDPTGDRDDLIRRLRRSAEAGVREAGGRE